MAYQLILPRQGEVAGACQTEGGGKGNRCCVFLPLRHLRCHLPLAGEDRKSAAKLKAPPRPHRSS
ncbi:MAG: hypothetical protein EOP66_06910 [Sphingomonas sp.]|nr:MAG: hypothetical protein EOP66_06910 [Sphingomonas sp.]